MNADHSRRTFLLGGLATGAVLLAGKTFLHPLVFCMGIFWIMR